MEGKTDIIIKKSHPKQSDAFILQFILSCIEVLSLKYKILPRMMIIEFVPVITLSNGSHPGGTHQGCGRSYIKVATEGYKGKLRERNSLLKTLLHEIVHAFSAANHTKSIMGYHKDNVPWREKKEEIRAVTETKRIWPLVKPIRKKIKGKKKTNALKTFKNQPLPNKMPWL